MKHFDTFSGYMRFVWAREFTNKDADGTRFDYKKNKCEKFGGYLSNAVLKPMDFFGINSRNPLLIVAMTVAALFVTTLLFYPTVVAGLFTAAVVAGIKIAGFTLTQMTIVGLCLKTLGRLGNQELMQKWDNEGLNPIGIGSVRL